MMYKALVSFTGLMSMSEGDVREISDISLANDLLNAGYIELVKDVTPHNVTEKKSKSPSRKGNKK